MRIRGLPLPTVTSMMKGPQWGLATHSPSMMPQQLPAYTYLLHDCQWRICWCGLSNVNKRRCRNLNMVSRTTIQCLEEVKLHSLPDLWQHQTKFQGKVNSSLPVEGKFKVETTTCRVLPRPISSAMRARQPCCSANLENKLDILADYVTSFRCDEHIMDWIKFNKSNYPIWVQEVYLTPSRWNGSSCDSICPGISLYFPEKPIILWSQTPTEVSTQDSGLLCESDP